MVRENEIRGDTAFDGDIATNDVKSSVSYKRTGKQEKALAAVLGMSSEQLLTALKITNHLSEGYIPSEVLVTLVRSRYGNNVVRAAVGNSLQKRLIGQFRGFLRRNPVWGGVVSRSSESEVEAISYLCLLMVGYTSDVSFPEVSFGGFVNLKLLDWLKSEIAAKNSMLSADSFSTSADEEGNESPVDIDTSEEQSLRPDVFLERKQDIDESIARCQKLFHLLTEKQRRALVLTELEEMTQKEAGEIMGLKEDAVRKLVSAAKTKLRNGDLNVG